MKLALDEWGDPSDPRIVCLHGVRNHGEHFALLAEALPGTTFSRPICSATASRPGSRPGTSRRIAPRSPTRSAPSPQRSSATRSAGGSPSSSPRARRSSCRSSCCSIPRSSSAHVALLAAENAREPKSYISFDELVERRYDESQLQRAPRDLVEADLASHVVQDDDGRYRYRYCGSAVVAAYGEMASQPPRFEDVRVPTLLVLGERSYLSYDHLLDEHQAALGDLLEVVVVPGGTPSSGTRSRRPLGRSPSSSRASHRAR